MNDYLTLALGIVCAGGGGELFVRGAVGMARSARISPGLVGATVAAFATSSPELTVSVNAALAKTPQIALGDALGSNVVNVALILGLALLSGGLRSPRESVRRDFPVALLVPVVTVLLLLDGMLSRVDGLVLLGVFSVWMAASVREARRQRFVAGEPAGSHRWRRAVIQCVIGLALLFAAGRLVVAGARGIALAFGLGEFVIGATIVAVGTSIPELATTMVSRLRGHDEVGLGTVLGSNIFNGLLIVAVASIICPIAVNRGQAAVALAVGLLSILLSIPDRRGWIGRWRGVALLALYVAYVTVIMRGGIGH